MRFAVMHGATRLLLVLAMAMTVSTPAAVRAATPADQASPEPPPPVPRPYRRLPPREVSRPARHIERAEARKPPEPRTRTVRPPAGAGTARGTPNAPAGARAPVVVAPPAAPPPPPQPPAPEAAAKDTGEPPAKIPRFAALKTDDTNMRKGPGQRYPIEWVYKRRDLPMEVEREYDVWRYVKDPDGVEGWVHQVTLSDRRTFIVQNKDAILRADPNDTASPVATLKVGVIGRLRECAAGSTWCQVQVSGYKGYLRRDQFWGLLPDEVLPSS